MKKNESIFLEQIYACLPRLLSFFDRDRWSGFKGVGDRQYTAWCFLDFANGTYQGAAHGLARLLKADLLPEWCAADKVAALIEDIFRGTDKIIRSNGSLEESFPNEESFCVTALAAHDLLWAHQLLPAQTPEISRSRLQTISRMIEFLLRADERHGFISNHLATATGALYHWHSITGDKRAEKRGAVFLQRILANASAEGWFSEYGSPDPGYQTLCQHYLELLDSFRPDLGLQGYLNAGNRFLSRFALPDGSFGGVYGGRRTGLYYPSGVILRSEACAEAAALAYFMENSIRRRACVTLAAMDDANLIPMFNAYAVAAEYAALRKTPPLGKTLPCLDISFQHQDFPDAGLMLRGTAEHYTIISTRLGGAYESCSRDGTRHVIDGGSIVHKGRKIWSTQVPDAAAQLREENDAIILESRPARLLRTRPTPVHFIILRLLGLTVLRLPGAGDVIKRMMAYFLMDRRTYLPLRIRRSIDLSGSLAVTRGEVLDPLPPKCVFQANGGYFRSIHMASAGYWPAEGTGRAN